MRWQLRSNPFYSQMAYVGALARVLESNYANVAIGVDVEHSVCIEVFGFGDVTITKLDVQRIGVVEVFNFHGLYPRSKNAL